MPLEPLPLKVLNRVHQAGIRVDFQKFLGDREAVDGHAAEALPVGPEAPTEVVAGLREIGAASDRLGRLERCSIPSLGEFPAQETQEHVEALGPRSRMPLEAGPLEPLGDAAGGGVDELIGERVAEEGEAAELFPVGAEAAAEVMPRLGKVKCTLAWVVGAREPLPGAA